MKLNEVSLNTTVKIKKLECTGSIRRRLLDLGMIEDTKVTPVLSSISRKSRCLRYSWNNHCFKERRF